MLQIDRMQMLPAKMLTHSFLMFLLTNYVYHKILLFHVTGIFLYSNVNVPRFVN